MPMFGFQVLENHQLLYCMCSAHGLCTCQFPPRFFFELSSQIIVTFFDHLILQKLIKQFFHQLISHKYTDFRKSNVKIKINGVRKNYQVPDKWNDKLFRVGNIFIIIFQNKLQIFARWSSRCEHFDVNYVCMWLGWRRLNIKQISIPVPLTSGKQIKIPNTRFQSRERVHDSPSSLVYYVLAYERHTCAWSLFGAS